MHTPAVAVTRLDPDVDDVTLTAWSDVMRTVGATERGEYAPAPPAPLDRLREQLAATDVSRWSGVLDGRVVGAAEVRPGGEPKTAFTRVYVTPDRRGRGVGRSLVAEVVRDRVTHGTEMLATTVLAGTPGASYAFDLGATIADELVLYALDLATFDRGALEHLVAASADGYDLVDWCGRTPDRLVDSYAGAKRLLVDAPNTHPPVVPPWDRELVRHSERERAKHGAALWTTAAVVTDTSTVAAFTEVEVGRSPVDASQEATVVVREHRRRGLATWVKAAMALRLSTALPELRRVSVTTAVANTGMRAVNERVGFRELARRHLVLASIATLAERLQL